MLSTKIRIGDIFNFIVSIKNRCLDLIFGNGYASTLTGIDEAFYLAHAGSFWPAFLGPALHYRLFGRKRGLRPMHYFDPIWYLARYDDVRESNVDPYAHYLRFGWYERRDPSAEFSTSWYLLRYRDVAAAGVNPLLHFHKHGISEGRLSKPSKIMQALADDAELIIHGGKSAFTSDFWTVNVMDFTPERIMTSSAPGWSTSIGNDPQLTTHRNIEAGFIRLKVRGRVRRMRASAAKEAVFEIYFDLGKDYSAGQSYTYQVMNGAVDIDDVVLIETDAHCIRINPVNTDCDFSIDHFQLEAMPIQAAVSRLYESYCWSDKGVSRTDREFLNQMTWSNILRFVRQQGQSIDVPAAGYDDWMAVRRISPKQRQMLRSWLFEARPSFSILMPTYKSELRYLKKAIDSVRSQIYPSWELCIVDDGSNLPLLRQFLDEQVRLDARIRVEHLDKNVGIAAATNRALEMAGGDFIALLDHDDEIAPQALFMMTKAINQNATADMLYSDEDKIDTESIRSGPMFKPDWSPELFMSCMYTCHLGVYRRSLVNAVGGFRSEFDFAQDYDMAFRVSAKARAIVHVPDVLYHWRVLPTSTAGGAAAKPTAELAARRAVQAHVDALDLRGTALPGPFAGSHRVQLDVIGEPSISIVIPTAGRRIYADEERWFILDLLRSVRNTSTYRNFEIVIVDNGDIEPSLDNAFSDFDLVRVRYDAPVFNIAEKLNLGVEAARSEYVILLNDDMAIITPNWMEELVSWVQRPGVVAAGAKLLFPNNKVQHAGILLLAQGPSHAYYEAADIDAGLVGSAILVRNYSALTGACLAVRKQDYQAVGGFDPSFRVNYNDVDFCLKLRSLGRIVYTPYAKLYHYESVSKDQASASELEDFNNRWNGIVGEDPFYNINFSQSSINAVTPFPTTFA